MPWIIGLLVIVLLVVAVWLRYNQSPTQEVPVLTTTSPVSTTTDPVLSSTVAASTPVAPSVSNLQINLQSGFDYLAGTEQEQFVSVSVNGQEVFANGVRTNIATGLAKSITVPDVVGDQVLLQVKLLTAVGVDQTFTLDLKQGRYVGVSWNEGTKKLELKQQLTPFQYD